MADRSAEALREQYKDGSNLMARVRLHGRFSVNRYGLFRWIFDRLSLPAGARVLELGTGTALLWAQNAERIPPGWRIALSDFSLGMIAEAGARLATVGRHFEFMQIDAQALPFADGSLDAVIANHMLYHVPDIPLALGEIRRVLAPGGTCYAATFGLKNMPEFDEMVRRFVGIPVNTAAMLFGLENGYEFMRAAFPKVECERYPDALEVTGAQPLIDYFNSTRMRQRATGEQVAALRGFIESEIAARGTIHITKDAGLLIASA